MDISRPSGLQTNPAALDAVNDNASTVQSNTIKAHKSLFRPDPDQYRKTKPQEMIDLRQAQMEKQGQLQAITVYPLRHDENGEPYYPIINGECRWLAFMQSDILEEIEAKIINENIADEGKKIIIQLMSNDEGLERVKILERAEAYKRLAELLGSQESVARELGVDSGRVSTVISLLKLPESIKETIRELSEELDINDANVLKGISKVISESEEKGNVLIEELRTNINDTTGTKPSARETVKTHVDKLPSKKRATNKNKIKEKKKNKLPLVKAENLQLRATDKKMILQVELKKEIAQFNISLEQLNALIEKKEEIENK